MKPTKLRLIRDCVGFQGWIRKLEHHPDMKVWLKHKSTPYQPPSKIPEEDAEWQRQFLNDDPGLVAKKFNLKCKIVGLISI